MFDKIREYDGKMKDRVYMVGVNMGPEPGLIMGYTEVIDKRQIVEIPIDPRVWMSDEKYIDLGREVGRSLLLYMDKVPKKIPKAPESYGQRIYHQTGDDQMHRVYHLVGNFKDGYDIMKADAYTDLQGEPYCVLCSLDADETVLEPDDADGLGRHRQS